VPVGFAVTKKRTANLLGPALAESKRDFIEIYGTELDLLKEVNLWLDQGHIKDDDKRANGENGNSSEF
jgi:hypothetical protein